MLRKSIKKRLTFILAFLSLTTWGLKETNQYSTPFLIGKTGANVRIPNTWLKLRALSPPA